MNNNHKNNTRRLFLALWPDEAVRDRLSQLQRPLLHNKHMSKAKPVPAENLHLTLHFLGPVAESLIPPLVLALSHVHAPAFELSIDRWGFFSKPGLLWLGASQQPAQLEQLLTRTQKSISESIRGYSQKKFLNHITVFRKASPKLELPAFEPVVWQVNAFMLVESDTRQQGAEYHLLERWQLEAL